LVLISTVILGEVWVILTSTGIRLSPLDYPHICDPSVRKKVCECCVKVSTFK